MLFYIIIGGLLMGKNLNPRGKNSHGGPKTTEEKRKHWKHN